MSNDHVQQPGGMPEIALVLAGGLGRRLRPVVNDRPKVLAPVAGRPFLAYLLSYLNRKGLRSVILCVGYLADQVVEAIGDGRRWEIEVRYSREITPLGTAGALRLASAEIDRTFFVLNGDTLFLADLQLLWKTHHKAGVLGTLALLPVANSAGRGCVNLSADGKISSFEEKPLSQGPALINAGVYLLEPGALASVPPEQEVSLERQVFPRLAAQGQLAGSVQSAYFADIGTPTSLEVFKKDIQSGKIVGGFI